MAVLVYRCMSAYDKEIDLHLMRVHGSRELKGICFHMIDNRGKFS
jgi:hypothetical protein